MLSGGFASQSSMSAFDFIAESAKAVISSAKQRPLLFKATSDDETPTPGYIYEEITKLTWEDDAQCEDVLNFLIKRLEKDSTAVKLKCLRVLRHCVLKGHESFHRNLQRYSETLRNTAQYRGPPDPLRGDAPSKQVREAASELLQIVFEAPASIRREKPKFSNESIGNVAVVSSPPTRVQATPTSTSRSSGAFNEDGSKKMWGYGNPEFQPAPPNLLDRLKDSVSETFSSSSSNHPVGAGVGHSPSQLQAASASYNQARYQQPSLRISEDYQQRQPGQVGGGWDNVAAPSLITPQRSNVIQQKPPQTLPITTPSTIQNGGEDKNDDEDDDDDEDEESNTDTSKTLSQSSLEARLVYDITHSGVRALPSREALAEFCQRSKSLNMEQISSALRKALEEDDTAIQLRALAVMESLVAENANRASQELRRAEALLTKLRASPKNNVANKAIKVSLLLGFNVDASTPPSSSYSPQPQLASTPPTSTISIFDEPVQLQTPTTTPSLLDMLNSGAVVSSKPHDNDELFSGLSLRDKDISSSPASSQASSSLLDLLDMTPQSQPPLQTSSNSSHRDLMDLNITAQRPMQPLQWGSTPIGVPSTKPVSGGIAINPALIEKTRETPNYIVSSAPTTTKPASNFGFVSEKRDAFDFIQDEVRSKTSK